MSNTTYIILVLILFFVCLLNAFSMLNFKTSSKFAYSCFFVLAFFCMLISAYIINHFDLIIFRTTMLFTICLPYFILILIISKDKISQTVFNFWLWINIYAIIATLTAFINDFTFDNNYFLSAIRLFVLVAYFIIYNKYLKKAHKFIIEKLNVNWWIFSFIPLFFALLIILVNYYFRDFHGYARNYPLLFIIHTLMILVYLLIFYTFKTAYDGMEKKQLAQSMKDQMILHKKQLEFQMEKSETEKIFRHDAKHRDKILLGYLENNDIIHAKELIKGELNKIEKNSEKPFCENSLINTILYEYKGLAEKKHIKFIADINMQNLSVCDETEFCVMLSNLLENSLEASKEYIYITIKQLNHQLSINIKNDYDGVVIKNTDGKYETSKKDGLGLGIKSVSQIIKNNHGLLKINDDNNVFDVFVTLKN